MDLSLAPRGQPEKPQFRHQVPASVEPRFDSLGAPILDRIYTFCEDSDLLVLGKVSKLLNTTALRHLFSRNDSARWLFGTTISLVELRNWGPSVTPALCAALFVKPSNMFTYAFQPDADMIFNDLHHLTHFLGRPPPGDHSTVVFSFFSIDGKIIRGFPDPFIDFDRFLEGFKHLLDTAVKRGSADVSVAGGEWFSYIHRGKAPEWLQALNVRNQDGSGESPLPDSSVCKPVGYYSPVVTSQTAVSHYPPDLTRPTAAQLQKSRFVLDLTGRFKRRFGLSRKSEILAAPASTDIGISTGLSHSTAEEANDLPIGVGPKNTFSMVEEGNNLGLPAPEADLQGCDGGVVEDGASISQLSPLTTSPVKSTNLVAFSADSLVLFEPPILDWFLNTLSSSPSLTKLSFRDIILDPLVWARVLSSVYLPKLEALKLIRTSTVSTPTGILIVDLEKFLLRHPTMRRLDLWGITFGSEDVGSLNQSTGLLPHLEYLASTPYFVKAFLSQLSGPRQHSRLSSIGIVGECIPRDSRSTRRTCDYPFYTVALQAMAVYPHVERLRLVFPMAFDGSMVPWVQTYVDLRKESPIARLTNIKHLVLQFGFYAKFNLGLRVLFCKFIGLFPSVESVHFDEMDSETEEIMEKERFEMTLANACPKLKRYQLGSRDAVVLEGIIKRIGFRLHIG